MNFHCISLVVKRWQRIYFQNDSKSSCRVRIYVWVALMNLFRVNYIDLANLDVTTFYQSSSKHFMFVFVVLWILKKMHFCINITGMIIDSQLDLHTSNLWLFMHLLKIMLLLVIHCKSHKEKFTIYDDKLLCTPSYIHEFLMKRGNSWKARKNRESCIAKRGF